MKVTIAIVIAFVSCWVGLLYLVVFDINLVGIYQEKMQVVLFSGFLTIGGFLLTLKTFILIKLKEGLYDREDYKKRVDQKRQLNKGLSYYGPLRRLGNFLVYGVASALITALSQLTIGFIPHPAASAFCMTLAIFTGGVVIMAWWLIKVNLHDWFELLESEKRP